ncbi:MAG: 5-dehydro-4-deoxy-D-glucuronate isomerase [bacterium]|nr:5-dehydro-4-deoxy-D-glucuronate isomerase [bacterium]
METRYIADPVRFARMTAREYRENLLIENLFESGALRTVYVDTDRAIVGGAMPTAAPLALTASKELAAEYFAQRREAGVINIGAAGAIAVDGKSYPMANRDCLYIGRGSRAIAFTSADPARPAVFYILSYPAAAAYPTTHATHAQAAPVRLGSPAQANVRTIRKYIHPAGIKSCQLVMGFTDLAEGSVWNTMPPHTHERRSEIYCYFDLPPGAAVFHLTGRPDETRHLVVRDRQVVISPSWSIHSGVGSAAYAFIWGMGGENQDFDDMDVVKIEELQ